MHQAIFIANVSRFIPGNQLILLQNGAAYFPAIEAAFDQARHEIYLEMYIYENNATGRRIADALKRAVLRGVNVYMLIDGNGSKTCRRACWITCGRAAISSHQGYKPCCGREKPCNLAGETPALEGRPATR